VLVIINRLPSVFIYTIDTQLKYFKATHSAKLSPSQHRHRVHPDVLSNTASLATRMVGLVGLVSSLRSP